MYPHVRREQRGTRLVNSEKEGAGRLVQEVQTRIASYVRGGVQQTGPSARLGHTPPGFTGQAAPDWIEDRRWIGDIRRKEQMLVKVVTLEATNSGNQAQYLGNRPRTFAQVCKVTFRKRIDSGPRSQRTFALSTVVAR